jgi:hypothetical protein
MAVSEHLLITVETELDADELKEEMFHVLDSTDKFQVVSVSLAP